MKWLKEKYEKWCKETKRNGKILIGSMYEFFDWLEDKEFNAEANDVMDRMIKESGIEPPSTEVKGQQGVVSIEKINDAGMRYAEKKHDHKFDRTYSPEIYASANDFMEGGLFVRKAMDEYAASLLKERNELKAFVEHLKEDIEDMYDEQHEKEKEIEYLRNLLRQSGTFFRDELTDNARKLFDSIDESLQRKPNSDIQVNGASQQQPNSSNAVDKQKK